jgi:putative membrane protein
MPAWLMVFLKGVAMGAADVVPGVSGGTIAFITGIYERLLNALKSLHPLSLVTLYKEGFPAFWRSIDGGFLLALFSGVVLSLVGLATIINHLMDAYPILVWSFFFGLVSGSIYFLLRQISQWNQWVIAMLFFGAIVAVSISFVRPAQLPDSAWMMFVAGFIAICAMILPGISGSFILLLMGMYSVVIDALSRLDVALLACFIVGCFMGLMVFSHLLSFLLRKYYMLMLGLLTGFLIGSLNVLWPWKAVVETTVNRHGELIPLVQHNISPGQYHLLYGQPDQAVAALCLFSAGFLIVFLLEYIGKR